MTFVTLPLSLVVLVLIILAVSFLWSFRLAKKLDKAYDDYDNLWKVYKNTEDKLDKKVEDYNALNCVYKELHKELQKAIAKQSVQYNWKAKSK